MVPDGSLHSGTKKRKLDAANYPPPPPPPPPPVDNPYYQEFAAEYWKHNGYLDGGAAPPPVTRVVPKPVVVLPPTRVGLPQEEYPVKTDRRTYFLATPEDAKHLSEKQCYVRSRLAEIFIAEQEDMDRPVRHRKAGFVGQVGIRCVFCVPAMKVKHRADRAICYPTSIAKFYQTSIDMQHFHFSTCPAMPTKVKETYQNLSGYMKLGHKDRAALDKISPKEYWEQTCEKLGLEDYVYRTEEVKATNDRNSGVMLKEGHGLVPRARLPDYAEELFLPPGDMDGKVKEDSV